MTWFDWLLGAVAGGAIMFSLAALAALLVYEVEYGGWR